MRPGAKPVCDNHARRRAAPEIRVLRRLTGNLGEQARRLGTRSINRDYDLEDRPFLKHDWIWSGKQCSMPDSVPKILNSRPPWCSRRQGRCDDALRPVRHKVRMADRKAKCSRFNPLENV